MVLVPIAFDNISFRYRMNFIEFDVFCQTMIQNDNLYLFLFFFFFFFQLLTNKFNN